MAEVKKFVFLLFGFVIVLLLLGFGSASDVGLIENSTWQSNLTAVRFSATAFGDIDNDGDLDLALSGCLSAGASDCDNGAISKIYVNNGTSLVENETWQENLTGAGYGSLSFGDIDNDGDLDLAIAGCPSGTEISCANIFSKIYLNNGTSLVESSQWQSNLTGIYRGGLTFNDIDNDGDLDLALSGKASSARIAKIYLNNGTSLVESSQWQSNLTGIYRGMMAFGDIDNDGDLDCGLVGTDSDSNNNGDIYLNNGTSLIYDSSWSTSLKQTNLASIVFGDYDNDGDLDLIETGIGDYLYLYNNTGSTFVVHQKNSGEGGDLGGGRYEGSTAWGDYDNDGDLDFVATGYEQGRSSMYENDNTHFVIDNTAGAGVHSSDLHQNALAWADLDNDADLDLINVGLQTASGLLAKIYINNNTISNTPPNASNSDFSSTYADNVLTLSWGNGSDSETNTSGLYYNLMVGNSTANHTIVSGVFGGSSGGGNAGGGASGYFGNMMQRKSIALNVQLESNTTYYWYVQTIDTGLAKSNWSVQQNFTTSLDTTKPNVTLENPSPNASLHTTNPVFVFNATVTDANLTNVTLYADFNGTMIANETNSSGINGTYTFERNLTGNSDGMYQWYIYACDGDSNCQTSGTRSFYLDRGYPVVSLVSPANGASWTSSSTVTFSYNVSDVDVANCSLMIDGGVDQTSTSVSEGISQEFTKAMSNGNYSWYVNCSDYVGYANSSAAYSLTVNYVSDDGSPGGGGGGGTPSYWTMTYPITDQQLEIGYTRQLPVKHRVRMVINGTNHYVGVVGLTSTTATVNVTSDPVQVVLGIGENKSFDLTGDGYYDIYVLLNDIVDEKADITIQRITEIIEVEEPEEEEEEVGEEEEEKKGRLWFGFVLVVLVLAVGVLLVRYLLERHRIRIVKEKMKGVILRWLR